MEVDEKVFKKDVDWRDQNIVSVSLKKSLLIFTLFFWIVGGLFAAIGGWHISQTRGYKDITDLATDVYSILSATGCFVFVVSSFGVLGTLRENVCLLRMYKISLITILVAQLCAGVIGFAFWPEIKKSIDINIRNGIQKYTANVKLRKLMDKMQRGIGCCGSLSIEDWDSNDYYRCKYGASYRSCGVPWSCCLKKFQRNRQCGYKIRKKRSKVDMEKFINTIGCLDKFFEMMRKHMSLIGGVTCGGLVVLVSGIFMAHLFGKQIKKLSRKYQDAVGVDSWRGTDSTAGKSGTRTYYSATGTGATASRTGFSGTNTNFSGTGTNFSGTGTNFTGTGTNFSATGTNFTGTGTNFSATGTDFSKTGTSYSAKGTSLGTTATLSSSGTTPRGKKGEDGLASVTEYY